jgi:hypothetical protein
MGRVVRRVAGRDVVWVWPDQFTADGLPDGCAVRVDRFLGTADSRRWGTDRVWVCGSVFDPWAGRFRDGQVTLVISQFQPLAHWPDPRSSRHHPARVLVGGRTFERRF